MPKKILTGLAIGICLFAIVGTANAIIVNIDSAVHGTGRPLQVYLTAGTYSLNPIGVIDGGQFNSYTVWSSTNCSDPDGCIPTSPTTVKGWMNAYYITSLNLTYAAIEGISIDLSTHPTYFRVSNGLYYPNSLLALSNALSATFTVDSNGLVGFYIGDSLSMLFDNAGGMSLELTSANPVPEPCTMLLLGSGLAGLVAFRKRFRAV